ARAENFLEEDKGTREFPKAFSVRSNYVGRTTLSDAFDSVWGGCHFGFAQCKLSPPILALKLNAKSRCFSGPVRQNPILARESGHSNCAKGQSGVQRCYYPT